MRYRLVFSSIFQLGPIAFVVGQLSWRQLWNSGVESFNGRTRKQRARKKFLQAYEREPNNPLIVNNLKHLDSSQRWIPSRSRPSRCSSRLASFGRWRDRHLPETIEHKG